MNIVLSHKSGLPIYEQIKEQIKAAVLSGDICAGDALPSIRRLARDLQVSVMTTTRAYGDLEAEGFVHTIPGKGVFANEIDKKFFREHYISEAEKALKQAVRYGKTAGLAKAEISAMLNSLKED